MIINHLDDQESKSPAKRARGRPKGSKGKRTLINEVITTETVESVLSELTRIALDKGHESQFQALSKIADLTVPRLKAIEADPAQRELALQQTRVSLLESKVRVIRSVTEAIEGLGSLSEEEASQLKEIFTEVIRVGVDIEANRTNQPRDCDSM